MMTCFFSPLHVSFWLGWILLAFLQDSAMAFDENSWQSGRGYPFHNVSSLDGTCFDEYWDQLPSLAGFDKENRSIVVDGYSFTSRMSVIKFLIEFDHLVLWGATPLKEYHWLWGYGAQLDWQYRSGRLNLGSAKTTTTMIATNASAAFPDTIAPTSWWGYMNFCFSIAILIGGKESGVLDSVFPVGAQLLLDEVTQQLVDHDEGVQKSIQAWQNLFENGYVQYRDKVHGGSLSNQELQEARFRLRKHVWEAHTTVIHAAMNPYSDELLAKMPVAERQFGSGWASMVELLAASAFPTDLLSLVQDGAGFLPLQVITDEIWQNWKNDPDSYSILDRRRMIAVESCYKLLGMAPNQLQLATVFWKRVVRNDRISRKTPQTIFDLVHGSPLSKTRQIIRVLFLSVQPREWIATFVVALLGGTIWLSPNAFMAHLKNLPWLRDHFSSK
jgi:hypothetical protein